MKIIVIREDEETRVVLSNGYKPILTNWFMNDQIDEIWECIHTLQHDHRIYNQVEFR